jgi:signal transduction histidine kinase
MIVKFAAINPAANRVLLFCERFKLRQKTKNKILFNRIEIGAAFAFCAWMSTLEQIYKKMEPLRENSTTTSNEKKAPVVTPKQMGREIAHELNNILAVIQGYADHLILKNRDLPTREELQIISENSRRAVKLIRTSVPPRPQPLM